MSIVKAIADAIQRQEGWFPGSASFKHNNPGNIMDIEYYRATKQFRLQQYPTLEAGRAALEALVAKYIGQGHTLSSFFAKYAPSGHGDNQPNVYAKNVAQWTGLPIDVPLNTISASPTPPAAGEQSSEGGSVPWAAIAGLAGIGLVFWWLWD